MRAFFDARPHLGPTPLHDLPILARALGVGRVMVKDEKMTGFDYDHCKGCGICALECPGKKGVKAIVMEEEGK